VGAHLLTPLSVVFGATLFFSAYMLLASRSSARRLPNLGFGCCSEMPNMLLAIPAAHYLRAEACSSARGWDR
jgi:hypothetical protein